MSDLKDSVNERLSKNRKKAYNWPKLIVMVLVIIAIIYLRSALDKSANVSTPSAGVSTDSIAPQPETGQHE